MGFRTKLDYSDNRQIIQRTETSTHLSGGTIFGLPFNQLPFGPNPNTSGLTNTANFLGSTFSGNSATTVFAWYDNLMEIGHPYLSAITPSNSGITQQTPEVFTGTPTTIIDGNTVALAYTGISYDLSVIAMYDLGGGDYSGTVVSNIVDYLSATTLDYTGRTIWVDVSGITRTNDLIITNNAAIGRVWTCIDAEGKGSWEISSGSTGGSSISYWSAGTGTDAITTLNSGNIASDSYALAEGFATQATGFSAHAEGDTTVAGERSHAEGQFTTAINSSHAEGRSSQALGTNSHAEGSNTIANGDYTHAEGFGVIASGLNSHAEGKETIASGISSHAQGEQTTAGGDYSHASGYQTLANGFTSFVHGTGSTAANNYTMVLGRNITGTRADTTYVDKLNIKNIPIGISIENLGIDASGNVVVGSGSGTTTGYWTASTGLNAIVIINSLSVASGDYSLGEGFQTTASGTASHAEGNLTVAGGEHSHAEGNFTMALGDWSHSEGVSTQALNYDAHAEGNATIASGRESHAQGFQTTAFGQGAHSEGNNTQALGIANHSEGNSTISNNDFSHAEGSFTRATGLTSHAEGVNTIASGSYSHSQNSGTTASGESSHAGGANSQALGNYSFVHGLNSIASGTSINVLGANITGTTPNTTYVENLSLITGATLSIGAVSVDAPTLQLTSASLSTGLYLFSNSGITITAATATTFNLGAVRGWIVDSGDVLNANPIFVSYSGGSGLTTPYMVPSPASYLLINSASTLTIQNTKPTTADRRNNIYLGAVGHPNLVIDSFGNEPDIIMNEMSQMRAMFDPINLINDGVIPYANSTNLTLANTSGRLYGLGIGFITNGNYSPTVINVPAGAPTTFQYRTQNSASTTNTTLIDPTNYDNAGVLTNVPGSNNNATNQRVYLLVDGSIRLQYGQAVYGTLSAAKEAAATESFIIFPNNTNLGLLIGMISIRKGASNLANTGDAIFLPVSKFGETVGATGGVSTATLQSAYNNSGAPEIVTNSSLLGVTIKQGSGSNTDYLLVGQNGSGTPTFGLNGNGAVTATALSISAVTFNKLLLEKVGSISGSTFTGSPKTANVIFSGNFTNTNYAIIINGEDERLWTSSNKTISGFTINANANAAFTGLVYWMTKSYGEV